MPIVWRKRNPVGRFVCVFQGRRANGDIVDILKEDSEYIIVFDDTGLFIDRPRWVKRIPTT